MWSDARSAQSVHIADRPEREPSQRAWGSPKLSASATKAHGPGQAPLRQPPTHVQSPRDSMWAS
eukprot:13775241-Heterocapsa_arctica.AAC.1